jgi:hypothetical protein
MVIVSLIAAICGLLLAVSFARKKNWGAVRTICCGLIGFIWGLLLWLPTAMLAMIFIS